jgi:serine/threonine-protein kinase
MVSERVEVRRLDVDVVHMLGKYRLFAAIGSGGMAEVYLAVAEGRLGFNKLVVIKRLREDLAEEEQFVQMFLDEARLAARLSHPNIVHAYEVGEEEGNYFIAMEYLDGQPLSRICSRSMRTGQRVPRAVAIRIVMDALNGLHG